MSFVDKVEAKSGAIDAVQSAGQKEEERIQGIQKTQREVAIRMCRDGYLSDPRSVLAEKALHDFIVNPEVHDMLDAICRGVRYRKTYNPESLGYDGKAPIPFPQIENIGLERMIGESLSVDEMTNKATRISDSDFEYKFVVSTDGLHIREDYPSRFVITGCCFALRSRIVKGFPVVEYAIGYENGSYSVCDDLGGMVDMLAERVAKLGYIKAFAHGKYEPEELAY